MSQSNRQQEFRKRLHSGQALLGTFIKTPSPIICEILGSTDLDAVCIDAEHAPFGRMELDACLHALRAVDMPALVRLPSAAPENVLNALDCGATGIVVPHVTSAVQAKSIIQSAHFGRSGRGYAGSPRAAGYTRKPMKNHLHDSRESTTVILQIEDIEAVDAIDQIAAVDGVDCLFVGRIDLTVALGADSPNDPAVTEAVEKVCKAGKTAGKPVGMFVPKISEVPYWKKLGAGLFLLDSDQGFLWSGARSLRREFDSI
jgi:2-keto-3-deoxy-L-rhamnonate aldolase RhmA